MKMREPTRDYKDYWEKGRDLSYYSNRYQHLRKLMRRDAFIKNPVIVDVGGGAGHFTDWLGVKNVTIVDISRSAKTLAEKKGYSFILADSKKIPLPNNYADVVFCFELLEHLKIPQKTVKEIYRILKNGGIAWIGVPNMPPDPPHHYHRWTKKEFLSMLANSGFKDLIFYFRSAFFIGILPCRIKNFLAKHIPNRFAVMFIARCKK